MKVRAFCFDKYHGKRPMPGSTKIRIANMVKYWDELDYYMYGEKPDVFIFQKVYCTYDYKLPKTYKAGITILDTCDPDWKDTPDIHIKETLDGVDGVVTPTKALADTIRTMTDTPVKIIKDRFDLDEFPPPKKHKGELKQAVWFGYQHNAELMNYVVTSLEKRDISLLVVSNSDPQLYRWANKPEEYRKKYTYRKFVNETAHSIIAQADVAVLPKGNRPQDKYKSENKTITASLCGLPVVTNSDELEAMMTAEARQKHIDTTYDKIRQDYDIHRSIEEYKDFIDEIKLKT